jgi:hypothetical protein
MPPSIERAFLGAPVTFGRGAVASSFQYILTGEEFLRVYADTLKQAGETIVVTGRLWSLQRQQLQVFRHEISAVSIPGGAFFTYALEPGALLNLRIATANQIPLNTMFVRAQIVRGPGPAQTVLGTLLQGYISLNNDLGWPGSPIETTHAGRGRLADGFWQPLFLPTRLEVTVPTGRRWEFVASRFNVTTDATVGNRDVTFAALDDTGQTHYTGVSNFVQTAGLTSRYSIGAGLAGTAQLGFGLAHISAPRGLELASGWKLMVLISGAGAGDFFAPFGLLIREWFDG